MVLSLRDESIIAFWEKVAEKFSSSMADWTDQFVESMKHARPNADLKPDRRVLNCGATQEDDCICVSTETMEYENDDLIAAAEVLEEENDYQNQLKNQQDDDSIVTEEGDHEALLAKLKDPSPPIHQACEQLVHDKVTFLLYTDLADPSLTDNIIEENCCGKQNGLFVSAKVFDKCSQSTQTQRISSKLTPTKNHISTEDSISSSYTLTTKYTTQLNNHKSLRNENIGYAVWGGGTTYVEDKVFDKNPKSYKYIPALEPKPPDHYDTQVDMCKFRLSIISNEGVEFLNDSDKAYYGSKKYYGDYSKLVSDEPKTKEVVYPVEIQSIELEHDPGPHLIVCLASVWENLDRELKIWCPSFSVRQYHGATRSVYSKELSSVAKNELQEKLEQNESLIRELKSEVFELKVELGKKESLNVELQSQNRKLFEDLATTEAKITALNTNNQERELVAEYPTSKFIDIQKLIANKLPNMPSTATKSSVLSKTNVQSKFPFDDENIPNLFEKIKGGIYTLPSHLSPGARDLISRMLMVDPMKRMTIPDIRMHPWFQAHLPRYLLVPPPDTMQQAKKIDEEILQEVLKMGGIDRSSLLESLRN